jgi:hypothetical protein
MDTEHIVIIVLLVFIVLLFLSIIISVVVAVSKVMQVARPIQNTIRTIRGIRKLRRRPSQSRQEHRAAKQAAKQIHTATRSLRSAIRSDLKALAAKIPKTRLGKAFPKVSQMIMQQMDPSVWCEEGVTLWLDHINYTFYYGSLALQNRELTPDEKSKMDWTAQELLKIQDQLALNICQDNSGKRGTLAKLLRDHILIVAKIAAEWRKDPTKLFNADLVKSWYHNADQTVQFLGNSPQLKQVYTQHLDDTAAYLTALAKQDEFGAAQGFSRALTHTMELNDVFCQQKC